MSFLSGGLGRALGSSLWLRLRAVCSDYCWERRWVLEIIVSQCLTESEIITVWGGGLALFIVLVKKPCSGLRNTPQAAGKILRATREIADSL